MATFKELKAQMAALEEEAAAARAEEFESACGHQGQGSRLWVYRA